MLALKGTSRMTFWERQGAQSPFHGSKRGGQNSLAGRLEKGEEDLPSCGPVENRSNCLFRITPLLWLWPIPLWDHTWPEHDLKKSWICLKLFVFYLGWPLVLASNLKKKLLCQRLSPEHLPPLMILIWDTTTDYWSARHWIALDSTALTKLYSLTDWPPNWLTQLTISTNWLTAQLANSEALSNTDSLKLSSPKLWLPHANCDSLTGKTHAAPTPNCGLSIGFYTVVASPAQVKSGLKTQNYFEGDIWEYFVFPLRK